MRDVILHGDALELLKTLESNSVDALCCDPPAGIAFMGKDWDNPNYFPTRQRPEGYHVENFGRNMTSGPEWSYSTKARRAFIDFMTAVMAECLRVVKPGGHALVWALPRTSHWTATALEDAGWEIRDCLVHCFGSGFPKSHDISKAIDKLAGAERQIIGIAADYALDGARRKTDGSHVKPTNQVPNGDRWSQPVTASATPDAQRWSGYGSALKPASEHWILARKPLAAANLASNVLAWGTGGLNIDKSRVPHNESIRTLKAQATGHDFYKQAGRYKDVQELKEAGRWPPNFLLSHSGACSPAGCSDDCPVAALDEQAGERKSGGGVKTKVGTVKGNGITHGRMISNYATEPVEPSEGMVSRFFPVFYASKASRRERNAGCEALPKGEPPASARSNPAPGRQSALGAPRENHHPTVKSLALMSWLVRLITPPSGTVLDCFAGSGSTLVACVQEGFHYIGMEQDSSYIEIAKARIAHAQREQRPAKPRAKITRLPKRPALAEQLPLFA